MSDPIEARFTKIVREMDAELTAASKEIADLKSKIRIINFPIEQASNCGKCDCYKHTPWRDDNFGYVCATCLVQIKDEEIADVRKRLAQIASQKLRPEMDDHSAEHADWEGAYEAIVRVARGSDA